MTNRVIYCHNFANFWRIHGDEKYEQRYLSLS
ncbi:DUF2753 family protein [Photobacterium sp. BZF1]|nr:DUF2753 family protein [Photobacterium sp. BZF1]